VPIELPVSSSCDICTTMNTTDADANSRPEIVEQYRDYSPPVRLKKWVETLLESVPPKYTVGLKTVVLTNQSALARNQRRQKIWQRGRKHRLANARGAYYRATRSTPATVWLYVDTSSSPSLDGLCEYPSYATFAWGQSCITK